MKRRKLIHSNSFHQPSTPNFCITLQETGTKTTPWVTHWSNLDDGGDYDGHYFSDVKLAKLDFAKRTHEAMIQTIECGGNIGIKPHKNSQITTRFERMEERIAKRIDERDKALAEMQEQMEQKQHLAHLLGQIRNVLK